MDMSGVLDEASGCGLKELDLVGRVARYLGFLDFVVTRPLIGFEPSLWLEGGCSR